MPFAEGGESILALKLQCFVKVAQHADIYRISLGITLNRSSFP